MSSAPKIDFKENLFESFKDSILNLDPVYFAQKYLTLDGKEFRLIGNGYKPFVDIYRYLGIKALERDSKPVVLVKGRQVGATTMAAVLELYFMCSGLFGQNGKLPIRVMHCFPTLQHAFPYAKSKLNVMMHSAKALDVAAGKKPMSYILSKLDTSTPANDSLLYKQFLGGNQLWIEGVGATGDRLRGRTVDIMFIDEVQEIIRDAMGAALKILAKAQFGKLNEGVQCYFGTPKAKGGAYWDMWTKSSQQYYYLGCVKCKKHFPLYTPGSNEWENIWKYGYIVECTHCKHQQDKRESAEIGKWVATEGCEDASVIGFHINQLYNPEITKESVIAAKPENHITNTERIYQNEVLGEFFNGDSSPLTADDIHNNAADRGRKIARSLSKSYGRKVYAGFDWGKKNDDSQLSMEDAGKSGGKSYSCSVVLSSEHPKLLNVEFATRLKNNNFTYKLEHVEQTFRKYSVDLAVGDIGYAGDLSEELQRIYGDRFLASDAKGQINTKIKLNDAVFPKSIMFERDYHIAELINMIKTGHVRFPYGSFDEISWLVDHCSSMEIKTTLSRVGEPIRRFVKGSIPNDGFMALLNAYLAYKYDISNGFKNDFSDQKKSNRAFFTTIHLPGLKTHG